jgi:hypothetical protein
MTIKKILFTLVFLIISAFVLTPDSYAVFNITAQPTEGGFDLRFGSIAPSDFKTVKEILLTVNSDIGKQYRIMQRVVAPIKSSDGTEISKEQFRMYPLVNSNSKGTLLYRDETPVSDFDTIFYTSNATGDNDSMRLVYTITPKENQVPGSYFGRIAIILSPVESNQDQVVITFNVYVQLSGSGVPIVEVSTGSSSKRLFLSSKLMQKKDDVSLVEPISILFKIRTPAGGTYRIYQALENSALTSSEGKDFDLTKILFSAVGGQKGRLAKEGDLKPASGSMLVYVSDAIGSPDEFEIVLKPSNDFKIQTTGQYRGKLNYVIEMDRTAGKKSDQIESFEFVVEIVPLFDIYAFSGEKEGVFLNFGEVSYKTGPKTSDVDIYVESNMGRPYQVIQKVSSVLVNKAGDKIPVQDFTVSVLDPDAKEEPQEKLAEAQSVKEGETIIYSSGPEGEGAHFKATYRLVMKPDTRGGSYSTQIGYSLSMN